MGDEVKDTCQEYKTAFQKYRDLLNSHFILSSDVSSINYADIDEEQAVDVEMAWDEVKRAGKTYYTLLYKKHNKSEDELKARLKRENLL